VNELLKNARWMDGLVWFVVCGFAWLVYETLYRGVPVTTELVATTLVTWGLAGVGFALISGYFSKRTAELKRQQASEIEVEVETPGKPAMDRAARRRAEREAASKKMDGRDK